MSLITLGLNHKTTPLELRERLAFTPQNLREALNSLIKVSGVTEAAIVSTCNRTELYCVLHSDTNAEEDPHNDDDQRLIEWFSGFHGLEPTTLEGHLYQYGHKQSIRHAMEVASGLASMVLGEPQITGQMKQAYTQAVSLGSVGMLLGKLFQHAFSVAKQVRTDTEIGASPVQRLHVPLEVGASDDLNVGTQLPAVDGQVDVRLVVAGGEDDGRRRVDAGLLENLEFRRRG